VITALRRELSEQERSVLDGQMQLILEKWKSVLRCGVCDRPLTGESVLYEIVLPYIAQWKCPRTDYRITDSGINYLFRAGLPCPRCHIFGFGPPGRFAVAFLCRCHVNMKYATLLKRIRYAVRIDPLPPGEGLPEFVYDPEKVLVSYVPLKELICILPKKRKLSRQKKTNPN
jgi:hypothetical protein